MCARSVVGLQLEFALNIVLCKGFFSAVLRNIYHVAAIETPLLPLPPGLIVGASHQVESSARNN